MSGARRRSSDGFDIDRLESVVTELVDTCHRLRAENRDLTTRLSQNREELSAAREQIAEQRSRREDAVKRIDDLIARLDLLDDRTASEQPRSSTRAE